MSIMSEYRDKEKSLINIINSFWENALISVFKIKKQHEWDFLSHLPDSLTFYDESFSDYTESIRMPEQDFVLEIHYQNGQVILTRQSRDREEIVYSETGIHTENSIQNAIKKALEAYVEYMREVEYERQNR